MGGGLSEDCSIFPEKMGKLIGGDKWAPREMSTYQVRLYHSDFICCFSVVHIWVLQSHVYWPKKHELRTQLGFMAMGCMRDQTPSY